MNRTTFFGAFVAAVVTTCLTSAGPAAAEDTSGYVGDSTCLACHEALSEGFTERYGRTIHAKVLNEVNAHTKAAERGCESCHGPGQAHVEAGGGRGVGGMRTFGSDTPEAVEQDNAVCLACHSGGERTYWEASVHHTRDISCTSCHTVMRAVSDSKLLAKASQVEVCGDCHAIQQSRIFRNAHMPLRPGGFQISTADDGKMSCSSCHQPHGSVTEKLIAHVSVNDQCLSCHADKRGPFLWEHSPVAENCLNCHDPHGGTRRAMLKMNAQRLCQTCHVSTGHATSARRPEDRFAVGTACLQCHTQVHGSNHPSGFALTR